MLDIKSSKLVSKLACASKTVLTALLLAGLIGGGASSSASADSGELVILHINDHHSHLQADSRLDLILAGEKTRVRSGGFPAVVSKFDTLSEGRDNVLKLHAGDAITGNLYYTLFKGKADAALMNEVCFDAFALGNHEFDGGDSGLVKFLDNLAEGDCNTPVLAANVAPKVGVSPLTKSSATDYFSPYTILERRGHKVGIIGIDIARKTKESSSPDETTLFLDEAKTAQRYIDELTKMGVDRIVLLTHYRYRNDLELARTLKGVDVIVGGDSHTRLGDFSALGLSHKGDYPSVVNNNGGLVCVVQAWQYSQIVGELIVNFDDAGRVQSCNGTPHMMLADSFRRKNADGKRVELEGEARAAVLQAVDASPMLSRVDEDSGAAALLATFSGQVDALKAEIIGQVTDQLCLERFPGQGKSKLCDPSDTAERGSDISNLVAHAFREMSRTSDIAIQNGGGVRTDVAAGSFSVGDAYNLLPFANTLVELTMTGEEIARVLEEAMDYGLSPDGSTGAYPYAAGLRWDVDVSKPKGQRLSHLQFKGRKDSSWTALDKGRSYKVVTNNYISSGRDGYLTFGTVSKEGRVLDTYLDYAQSFVDYVKARGSIGKLPTADYSTQSFKN